MSEKLPEGWTHSTTGRKWHGPDDAVADLMYAPRRDGEKIRWQIGVTAPSRDSRALAEQDGLNMIAALDGRPKAALEEALALIESMVVERNELLHAADLAAERIDAAQKKISAMEERAEKYEASLDRASARMDAVVEKLDALGVPFCGGLVERIEALASERDAALAKVAALEADVQTLTEAREYLERNIGELEDRRDADEAHVADLELALSEARLGHDAADMALAEKTIFHRAALSVVQRLKVERDNLRHTIATQQTRIDGLTAEASDKAPQLLRDSMRVTQEENARLRAEVSALTAKVATSEAYIARHNEANARAVQERNTCIERMESLRADLAKVSEGYARVKGEREACAADVTALRKQLHALRDERDALLKDRSLTRLERAFSEVEKENESMKAEVARLTTRATTAEGYAQHLLSALNAVSGFKGMP